jgi:hypothetical protein
MPGQPPCQPESVSPGFESNGDACDGTTLPDGLVTPARAAVPLRPVRSSSVAGARSLELSRQSANSIGQERYAALRTTWGGARSALKPPGFSDALCWMSQM